MRKSRPRVDAITFRRIQTLSYIQTPMLSWIVYYWLCVLYSQFHMQAGRVSCLAHDSNFSNTFFWRWVAHLHWLRIFKDFEDTTLKKMFHFKRLLFLASPVRHWYPIDISHLECSRLHDYLAWFLTDIHGRACRNDKICSVDGKRVQQQSAAKYFNDHYLPIVLPTMSRPWHLTPREGPMYVMFLTNITPIKYSKSAPQISNI